MDTPCPLCGSTSSPKFSKDSDWCASCAHDEIVVQTREDHDVVHRQVFET